MFDYAMCFKKRNLFFWSQQLTLEPGPFEAHTQVAFTIPHPPAEEVCSVSLNIDIDYTALIADGISLHNLESPILPVQSLPILIIPRPDESAVYPRDIENLRSLAFMRPKTSPSSLNIYAIENTSLGGYFGVLWDCSIVLLSLLCTTLSSSIRGADVLVCMYACMHVCICTMYVCIHVCMI